MPRELIAPAQEQVAFREYESPPLQANQIRVKSQFGAAKHGGFLTSPIANIAADADFIFCTANF